MKFSKFIAVFLVIMFVFGFTSNPSSGFTAVASADKLIKIGLKYGSNEMPSANLLNSVGKGYSLGYFDEDQNFTGVYQIDTTAITICKDKSFYWQSKIFHETSPSGSYKFIGAYHVEISTPFSTAQQANEVKSQVEALGYEAFVAYFINDYYVRIGSYKDLNIGEQAKNEISGKLPQYTLGVVGNRDNVFTVCNSDTGKILFEFDVVNKRLGVSPMQENGEKTQTWQKGFKYNGSFEFARVSGNNLTVINVLPLEDYIKGVVPYEMSPSWNVEALKVQAICARSYTITSMTKHSSLGFNLCNTTHCQVYYGTNQANDNTNRAVDETANLVVKYNGKNVPAYYHSSSGGYTESSRNVWGGDIGYLQPVYDDFADLSRAINGIWSFNVYPNDIKDILNAKGYKAGNIVNAYVSEFTEVGNVFSTTFVDDTGKEFVFKGETARLLLNSSSKNIYTYSQRFNITPKMNLWAISQSSAASKLQGSNSDTLVLGKDGKEYSLPSNYNDVAILSSSGVRTTTLSDLECFVLAGRGWGNNVGMSQYGARALAEMGRTYEEIIKYYYTGVEVGNAY